MSKELSHPFFLFHVDQEEFKTTLEYTQGATGFQSALIEKDYYCSLILQYLFQMESGIHPLVFKGGTCLNKCHLGFYRLSEDLDFCISVPLDSKRSIRSKVKEPIAQLLNDLPQRLPVFKSQKPLTGSNGSTQYNAEYFYGSVMSNDVGRIKVEISIREPLMLPVQKKEALTLLMNPFTRKAAVSPLQLLVINLREAMAEKVRATLSRRVPAIRDLFDLGHAHGQEHLRLQDAEFLELVKHKLNVPGSSLIPLTPKRLEEFKRQIDTELRPVLRDQDFENFHFEDVTQMLMQLIQGLGV